MFWGYESFWGIKLLNSHSDVIFPHKKFTWADFGGYKYRYTPRRYAPVHGLSITRIFYARQHVCYSAYATPIRPSVCPSVTRVYCIRTAERIIEILSVSDRPIIPVFRHQASLLKSDGFIPNGGAKYKWGQQFSTNMRQLVCGYISETVIDRGIVTIYGR